MPRIDPEGRLTRAERLVVVIALAAALVVHLVIIFGWGQLSRWAEETQKKERLVVIRRVRDIAPEPLPQSPRETVARPKGAVGGTPSPKPPPPKPAVKEEGEPPPEPELSDKMEEDLQEEAPEEPAGPEEGDNTVSVVTDLSQASFTVSGPAEYRGSGTFWLRKGAPAGTYTTTFHPVAGYATPPIQTKELVNKGQIVFVGKYKKTIEVVVMTDHPEASFVVYRPDGKPLPISRSGRVFLEDLPAGTYTAVFKDIPGHITPAPVTRTLNPGSGALSFFGEYQDATVAGGGGGTGAGSGAGTGLGAAGRGVGGGGRAPAGDGRGQGEESGLDTRVKIVVKSYPQTSIEDSFDPIAYPEVVIRRSNFQRGWCQVYLIVAVDDDGEVRQVAVERPGRAEQAQFRQLIDTVERAVRGWDYDKVSAEVHVDARFYVE